MIMRQITTILEQTPEGFDTQVNAAIQKIGSEHLREIRTVVNTPTALCVVLLALVGGFHYGTAGHSAPSGHTFLSTVRGIHALGSLLRPKISTTFLAIVSMTSRIFSLWSSK
jgi:hypothetical membrane protein